MTPGTQDTPPGYKLGEFSTDKAAREDNTASNPLGSFGRVNPLINDAAGSKQAFDELSITELISKGKPDESAPEDAGLPPTDQALSDSFDSALSHVREIQGGVIRGNRVKRNRTVARALWGNLA
jgi:hypothetical protein